jgi:hypothetical protein
MNLVGEDGRDPRQQDVRFEKWDGHFVAQLQSAHPTLKIGQVRSRANEQGLISHPW